MSQPIIEVQNLSKKYRLGQVGATTLSEDLARLFSRDSGTASDTKDFWALRDVSFAVNAGDVVGIIGGNGAGKSTLLKILSRITEPTAGRAILRGRVASLLEVGTGFQDDLTGRENVFLNGAILGMKTPEIATKFDEIVAFAEVEKFIDTPVKHYSSGMRVRLAFAVAAHLESEILIVDEVLAVGDAQFQKKCLGKMNEVSAIGGRTVLFVSHSLGVVTSLCPRCILLEHGRLTCFDRSTVTVSRYLARKDLQSRDEIATLRTPGLPARVLFTQLACEGSNTIPFGAPLQFRVTARAHRAVSGLSLGASLFQITGECVGTLFTPGEFSLTEGEARTWRLSIPRANLAPGDYYAAFGIGTGNHRTVRHDDDIVIGLPTFRVSPVESNDLPIANWHPNWGPINFAAVGFDEIRPAHGS